MINLYTFCFRLVHWKAKHLEKLAGFQVLVNRIWLTAQDHMELWVVKVDGWIMPSNISVIIRELTVKLGTLIMLG